LEDKIIYLFDYLIFVTTKMYSAIKPDAYNMMTRHYTRDKLNDLQTKRCKPSETKLQTIRKYLHLRGHILGSSEYYKYLWFGKLVYYGLCYE